VTPGFFPKGWGSTSFPEVGKGEEARKCPYKLTFKPIKQFILIVLEN
jgi:hypothetical protein